ncbi:MAG: hypothetical protein EAZ35_02275 [Sphingobacteriia bacterium]|nr:MAG: hypothetical protein EAZ35_02275 [Sphingobacteriia bacterium]
MKVIERLQLYFSEKKMSLNSVDKSLNMGGGYFGKQIKNNASIGSDVLQKIILSYPDLNLVWLMTGQGDMILTANELAEAKIRVNSKLVEKSNDDLIEILQTQVKYQAYMIDKLKQQVIRLGETPVTDIANK